MRGLRREGAGRRGGRLHREHAHAIVAADLRARVAAVDVHAPTDAEMAESEAYARTLRAREENEVEAVQTRADQRGRGIGAAMIEHAIEEARRQDLRLVVGL